MVDIPVIDSVACPVCRENVLLPAYGADFQVDGGAIRVERDLTVCGACGFAIPQHTGPHVPPKRPLVNGPHERNADKD